MAPLGMPCAHHPPCIMPPRVVFQKRRIARGPLSQVLPAAPDCATVGIHTKVDPRVRQRGLHPLPALVAAPPSSRR